MANCRTFLAVGFSLCVLRAQGPPPVPSSYQDLFTSMAGQIQSFASAVNQGWSGAPSPVSWSAQLPAASAEQGPSLLSAGYYTGVLQQLDSLKAIGVSAITVHIDFPILYSGYYQNQSDFQNYLDFYRQLASDIRARGLKLIVESTLVFPLDGIGTWDLSAYYASLTEAQYDDGRAQNALTIAQQIQPDYLSVITEPDTEASNSGFSDLGTVAGSTTLLTGIMSTLQQAGVEGVQTGAGCGIWLNTYSSFIQSFAGTGVNYIDMHVYPVNFNYLANALSYADTAASYGLPLSMSEAWAYKERDSEYGTLSTGDLAARDAFSFWEPIDIQFLQALVNYSQYKQLLFMAPYWSTYFHSYVDYNSTTGMTDAEISALAENTASAAVTAGQYSPTGAAWEGMIVSPADTAAPATPPNFTGQAAFNQINLTWSPATDNVGIAGYKLYKNGSLVQSSVYLFYQDLDLPQSTRYNYAVVAFDAAGNVSPAATLSISTLTPPPPPDTTPPSIPANMRAQAVSPRQINLSWPPSTDNVGVAGYQIFRGGSATTLALFGVSAATSFSDTLVMPATTYYYAVGAYDAAGNVSARSVTVAATSQRDTTPPSVPANLTGQAVSMAQVNLSWSASTDNIGVAGYKLYRGTSSTNGTLLAGPVTTAFADVLVQPNTTYYYSVAAVDTAGNVSAKSAQAVVKTLPDTIPPTVPANVTAVAVSRTRVNLSWSASTDNVRVTGYRVYRGTTLLNLTMLAGPATTAYSDLKALAGSLYYYTVAAVDAAGNVSAQSPAISVTTPH